MVFRFFWRFTMHTPYTTSYVTVRTDPYFGVNHLMLLKVFRMQKKGIRLVTKSSFGDPRRQNFRRLKILPLPSLYIFRSLLSGRSSSDKYYGKNHNSNHFTRKSSILQYPIIEQPFLKRMKWYSYTTISNIISKPRYK